ncbi:MAG: hypothetical protein IT355_01295 [Gemmatimonadaceae bacterium]|nr:hypothetical protein [Gemmatimonadaceae bacterium]
MPVTRYSGLIITTLIALPGWTAAVAQATAPPANWVVRTDAVPTASQVAVRAARGGVRVTTGPAAILYDSALRAAGDWRIEASMLLFEPGGRAEGFGVFFGGRDLTGPAQRYAYVLVRRDGRALLKVRDGAAVRTVRDWTASAAVPQWRATGVPGASVRYPLVVEARGERVTLLIGATTILDVPRAEVPTDGIVGLRINHALDVHLESLRVTPLPTR